MGAEPSSPIRKTLPLLLGATLLFWGWQSNLLVAAAVMALILEGARLVSIRWDLTEADFRRIWNFSSLLAITVAIYAFTSSDEGNISSIFHGGPGALRTATLTTARTASTFLRWLPLVFFLAVAAQVYSVRETMPLTAVSLWLRRRRDREIKAGRKITPVADINITYGYFIICIFSAGIHINEGSESFFWGQCVLFAWALWPFRAKRYRLIGSFLAFAVVVGFAFYTQFGVRYIQHALEGYNARWMSRLFHPATDPEQSMTAIGQLGLLKLSGAIVIRLHTPDGAAPPTYLREASYRGYYSANPRWYSIPRSNFSQVYSETNQTTWILQPHKTNSDTVNIACYLNSRSRESGSPKGLLPLPVDSHRLENFDAYILQKNLEGAVLAEGPHLLIFDALYGTGSTIDAPPDTSTSATNLDLLVPTNEIPALKQIITEYHLEGSDRSQTLQNVFGFFVGNFGYSTYQGPDKLARSNETCITRFLLSSRHGHCEYFATATVLLLRQLKIPARYAVGYLVHETSGSGYVVRERDAHSWCLAWNDRTHAWENFDTTPGSWIDIENKRLSPWQKYSDAWAWIKFQFARAKLFWSQGKWRGYVFWALIPLLAILLYRIVFRRGRARQKDLEKPDEIFSWPGLDSEFYQLERKLADHGLPRQPGETQSAWLERALADSRLADLRASLQELLRLHYRHRFDPNGLDIEDRRRLANEVRACLERLKGIVDREAEGRR